MTQPAAVPFVALDDRGASAVEYGLLLGAIAAVVIAALFLLGPVVAELFGNTCQGFDAAANTSVSCP